MDFKGYFATATESDVTRSPSRTRIAAFWIRCQIVSRIDLSQVRAICEAAMREYGVPARIGTDNDAPFAGTGLIPSSVRMPRKLSEYKYPKGVLLRRVNNSGDISWHKNSDIY
jgi:hypothetical protein